MKVSNTTSRTTLARFDIQAEADLHAAVLNIQADERLRASFEPVDMTLIATVASELGRNILKYGGGQGYLLVSWIDDAAAGGAGVEIKAADSGPGFADREAALKDRYSTGGTLGLGLPGAARIMDTLEIDSKPDLGSVVTARKWVKQRVKPRAT